MVIKMKVHQLKIDFNVTESVKRFVYVYIIEAKYCYLIDSGVYGCEKRITNYLESKGLKPNDVKGIFLTHAHPDHIGSAAWWKDNVLYERRKKPVNSWILFLVSLVFFIAGYLIRVYFQIGTYLSSYYASFFSPFVKSNARHART